MRASVSQLEITMKELEESLSKVHMEGTVLVLAYKKGVAGNPIHFRLTTGC